jgi:mRNA-degrading endonuclease RelE of RelBE toxin-antitoxin system
MEFWRYRIGDFRLVIKPTVAESEIDVITFSARGAAYD